MRLIRAVRELNAEHGYGIRVIALHTEAERRATFVRAADEARRPPRDRRRASPTSTTRSSGRALRESRADAAWVGWGFVAEDPAFAELCASLGVDVHRPAAGGHAPARRQDRGQGAGRADRRPGRAVERRPGRERRGRAAARRDHRLPADRQVPQRRRRPRHPDRPVRGRARRRRSSARRSRPLRTFGDPTIFMERLVEGGRHVEVQVIADQHGNVWAPGVRDCSVQRRNQKVIEESSSPALSPEQDASLRESAKALVKAAGYVGAGTVEFLYQPEREAVHLPRGQHPAAGRAPGHRGDDRPRHRQAAAARGRRRPARGRAAGASSATPSRPGSTPRTPSRGSRPAPGHGRAACGCPPGPGVRVDTGMSVGDVIPPAYDSMVAKIIAWGRDRPEALARLRCRAARHHRRPARRDDDEVLPARPARPARGRGRHRRHRLAGPHRHRRRRRARAARLRRAGPGGHRRRPTPRRRGSGRRSWPRPAAGGRAPRTRSGRTVELGYRGQVYRLTVAKVGRDRYRVRARRPVRRRRRRPAQRAGEPARRSAASASPVVAVAGGRLAPGRGRRRHPPRHPRRRRAWCARRRPSVVVAVRVAVGQEVEAGQTIVVLESMKMETAVRAPFAGRVREVLAAANAQVDAGAAAAATSSRPATTSRRPSGDRVDAARRRRRATGGAPRPRRCRCSPRCRR